MTSQFNSILDPRIVRRTAIQAGSISLLGLGMNHVAGLHAMAGELVVARASSTKYEELGRVTLRETTRQAPALSNGRLYLRDGREILCVDVRKP